MTELERTLKETLLTLQQELQQTQTNQQIKINQQEQTLQKQKIYSPTAIMR